MFLQEFGGCLGVLDMTIHADAQGFKPLQEKPGVERGLAGTHVP